MTLLDETLAAIRPVQADKESEARAHLDNLTKPPGSLGELEQLALRYCLITGSATPVLGKKRIYAFAGDHGVCDEGVSAYPREVTSQMVANMLAGGAAINVLCRHVGAEVRVVDVGMDALQDETKGAICRKVRRGTANMAKGPAMTVAEARQALEVGIELAFEAADQGVSLLGTGEMGIGNTTPSAALMAALLPAEVRRVTGRGTGIDDQRLEKKIEIIESSLAVNRERLTDPLSVLAALGGLEIAAIAGLVLGAASRCVPVVIDGFVSSAGALVACRLCEAAKGYLFFAHASAEAGHAAFFEVFGERPILDLAMRLGEGTGAALAMGLIEAAVKLYNEMATFASAQVSGKE